MLRRIDSGGSDTPKPLEKFSLELETIELSLLESTNRTKVSPIVQKGDSVLRGQVIAKNEILSIHASMSGVIHDVDGEKIKIHCDHEQKNLPYPEFKIPFKDDLPKLIADMGLVGMGGSQFPSSIKLKASKDIHTLVVNVVECEPGIEIDECLLLSDFEKIKSGIKILKDILGFARVVIACKKRSLKHLEELNAGEGFDFLAMSNSYPAGAEKLIVSHLAKKKLPSGKLPFYWGYLVMSVASLWSFSRFCLDRIPCVERPLTVVSDQLVKNIIVPVGTSFEDVTKACGLKVDLQNDLLIAGGLMMGREVRLNDRVQKGTNALFIHRIEKRLQKKEEPCINCGSCFDICPLNLHPSTMMYRVKDEDISKTFKIHVKECFLCGACSAACPSEIPLVHYFHKGKRLI